MEGAIENPVKLKAKFSYYYGPHCTTTKNGPEHIPCPRPRASPWDDNFLEIN